MTSLQHRGISFLTCLILILNVLKLRKSIHWTKELLELSWSEGGSQLFTFLLLLSWFLSLSWLPIKWHIRILKHAGNMVIYITMREIYPIRFDYVLADSASYFATPSTLIIPTIGSLSTIQTSDPYLKWRYYSVKEACTFTRRPYLSVHIILRRLFRRQILGDFMEFDFSETHSPTLVIVMLLSSQEEKKEREKNSFRAFLKLVPLDWSPNNLTAAA